MLTTDNADAQQVECDFLDLLSSCSDEFSVKGGSNGVKGRLKSSLNFWVEALDASDFVLEMIRRGYRLPFAQYPSQCFLKNNRSALQHPEFVKLLGGGLSRTWPAPDFLSVFHTGFAPPARLSLVYIFSLSFCRRY